MRQLVIACTLVFAYASVAYAQPAPTTKPSSLSTEFTALYTTQIAQAKPSVRTWITAQAAALKADASLGGVETRIRKEAAKRFGDKLSGDNALLVVFLVLKQALDEANSDKRYMLEKLQEHNAQAQALSEYLNELVGASQSLADKEQTEQCDSPVCTRFKVRTDSLFRVLRSANISPPKVVAVRTVGDLRRNMAELEAHREELRNRREKAQSAFQALDRKSEELFRLLATIAKTTSQLRSVSLSALD